MNWCLLRHPHSRHYRILLRYCHVTEGGDINHRLIYSIVCNRVAGSDCRRSQAHQTANFNLHTNKFSTAKLRALPSARHAKWARQHSKSCSLFILASCMDRWMDGWQSEIQCLRTVLSSSILYDILLVVVPHVVKGRAESHAERPRGWRETHPGNGFSLMKMNCNWISSWPKSNYLARLLEISGCINTQRVLLLPQWQSHSQSQYDRKRPVRILSSKCAVNRLWM